MKLYFKIVSFIVAVFLSVTSVYAPMPAAASDKSYNSLGYEIAKVLLADDFEDGIVSDACTLYTGISGSGSITEENGFLKLAKSAESDGHIICNIAVNSDGASLKSGQYFFELDITKPAEDTAYVWLSYLEDLSGTSSTDWARLRFTADGFTDDKSGDTYSVAGVSTHHISFLADIDEGRYYTWIDGNMFVANSESIYASNEGINSLRLVLPYSTGSSVSIDNLKVYKIAMSDELAVYTDTQQLTMDDLVRTSADPSDISVINDDLYLPKILRNGSEVKWLSSDESIISTDGEVAVVSENTAVTLTAVISKGEYSLEKDFTFTVIPPSVSEELEYKILRTVFDDDFDDGVLNGICSYTGEAQSNFSEKNGALQLIWNSTIPASTQGKVDFSGSSALQRNALVCIEADIKKTTKATSVFEITGADDLHDIVRIVFADGKLYDEANGIDTAAAVSNGYFNHITMLFDTASDVYYLWINGELHSYRSPSLYTAASVGAFQFSLNGGKGAHYAAVDNLQVHIVDATDYLDAQSRVRILKDVESLTEESLTQERSDNIKMSLNLMSKGAHGSDIRWETSDSDIVDKSGKVTRPRENEENKTVTLTATVSNGGYSEQKEFEFTVVADEQFTDPEIMTDEEFFGVWDKTDNAFITNGKIDYSYSENLKPALECVKNGDYDGAKEALLQYFKNRTPNHIYDSADRNNLVANLFADGWLFSGHNYYGGYMFAQHQLKAVEADVLANHIIPGDYNSLNVAAWHNEASVCRIYGADSIQEYRPKLEVKVNGKTRIYEAIEDAVVSAGKYMESHVDSNNEILCIRKFGGYLCDDETTALFKFDLRDLDVSATIESAKLILTCVTDTDSAEGKKLFIMREPTNSWSGDSVRWCDVNGYIYNNAGLPENRHWDQWAPYCNNEYGKQINRFYPVEQMMIEYRMTKDEKYAYQVLRAAGDYINDWGSWTPKSEPQTYGHFEYDGIKPITDTMVRGQYPRTLDSNGRMLQLARSFDIICDSESVNEEYSTAILKHVWDIAHSLRVYHTLEKHNWQMIEMQGLYTVAEIFPEFRDCLGDDGENWQTYSFNVLEDYIVDGYLEDGTYGEDTGGYSQGVLKSFSDIVSQMKKCGYQLKAENKDRLRSATYYNLLLRTPDGSNLAYGDEAQSKGSGKGETYAAFSALFSDTELKYVDTFGRYGTEPSWTSRHYPIGKTTFMRSNWSSNSPYLFTVNRGDVDPSHSHCDDNSVVVYAYGNTLLSDQGMFNYEATPEKLWGISSEAHNTVTINDKNQVSNITNGYTHQWTEGSGFDFLRQSTYTNVGYDHQRSIFFAKPSYAKTNYWIVSDLILPGDKSRSNTYKQHWHMSPDALISGDEALVQLNSNFAEGGNIIVASADSDISMKLEDGYWSYNYGNATETKWGYFEKTAQGDATLNTVLLPYETGDARVSAVKIATNTADTTATALKINIEAHNEVLEDYYYVSYEANPQVRSFANYSTDGNVAFISTTGSADIRQLSLTNGTYIKYNDRVVISTANKVGDINVEISDGVAYIGCTGEIDLTQLSLNLGADISSVYFNGKKMTFNSANGIISITGVNSSDNNGFIGQGVVSRDEIGVAPSPGTDGGSAGGSGGSMGGGVGVGGSDNGGIFSDIAGHWAQETILALYNKGIVKGKTQTTYCPEDTISRAEAIALIVRTLNKADSSHIVIPFADVSEDDWFYSVIRDALSMGIVSSDSVFRPHDSITRQEMSKLIVNAYELVTSSVVLPTELEFTDTANIDDWAKPFVSKGVAVSLIKGMDDGSFSPKRNVTRAEAAAFISRLQ